MTTAPQPFTAWLEARLGTRQWVVAKRMSLRLTAKGYTLAIAPARYNELEAEYRQEIANEKAFNVARALFPREADRMASDPDTWRAKIRAVKAALAAEGLL